MITISKEGAISLDKSMKVVATIQIKPTHTNSQILVLAANAIRQLEEGN